MTGTARRLFGDAGVYTAANIVTAAFPFLLVPILTRRLAPDEYGLVAMFTILVNVLAAVAGLNANSAVTVRFFQLSEARLREYLGACFAILGGSAAALLAALWVLRPGVERLTALPGSWALLALAVAAAQFVISVRQILWQVSGHPWRYASLALLQTALSFSGALLLVFVADFGWRGVVLGQLGGALVAAAVATGSLARFGVSWTVRRDDVADALRYGVPLIAHVIGGLVIASVDRVLITTRLDVGRAGIYMVALQLGMVLSVLTASFNRAYLPWLLRELSAPGVRRDVAIVRGTYGYFVAVLALAAGMTAVAPLALRWFAGPAFQEATDVIGWIAFAYAFGGMYYMVTNYVFHAGRTAALAAITVSVGTVGAFLSWALIGRAGIVGAGQAFLLSNALLFVGTWALAQRSHPMPWLRALGAGPHGSPVAS